MSLKFRSDAQLASCLVDVDRVQLGRRQHILSFFAVPYEQGTAERGSNLPHHLVPIAAGRLHVLLGRNGSGKSLLFNALRSRPGDRLVSSSLVFSLPESEVYDDWVREVSDELRRLAALSDEDRGNVPAEYLIDDVRPPIMSKVYGALEGPPPGHFLQRLTMHSEDVLTYFGFTAEEVTSWRDRWDARGQREAGEIDPLASWNVRELSAEFLLAGSVVLPHNPSPTEAILPWGEGSVLSGAEWLNDPELRDLVAPAVRQFIENASHLVLDPSSGGRLLAPHPESGPLRQLLTVAQQQAAVAHNDFFKQRLPFPASLFQSFSLGGMPYVASFRLEVDRGDVVEVIDVSPLDGDESLKLAFEELAARVVRMEAISRQDVLGIRLSRIDGLNEVVEVISDRVALCNIGIAELAIQWPPSGATWYSPHQSEHGAEWSRQNGLPRSVLPVLEWKDAVSGKWLDLERASLGQREVIALLVHLSRLELDRVEPTLGSVNTSSAANRHVVLLSDEFDMSLHPAASNAVLEQLAEVADQLPGISLVVSTHNVSALGRPRLRGVTRIFAQRSPDDFGYYEAIDASLEVIAEVLGATFLDSLKLKRLHLVLEGNHDELVIGQALRDQIPEIRDVDIVNGHGLRAWSGILANSLRFLDSPILLVHDKRDQLLESEWQRCQATYARTGRLPSWGDTGLSAMQSDVESRKKNKKSKRGDSELRDLLWLLRDNVFERDQTLAGRVHLFGLECEDIVDLLPISEFPKAKGFTDWASAHADFYGKKPYSGGEGFKDEFGIKDGTVRKAMAAARDAVHPELGRVIAAVRSLLDNGHL